MNLHLIQCKCDFNEDIEFHFITVRKIFSRPTIKTGRTVRRKKTMTDLINFKTLNTTRRSIIPKEEDIIHIDNNLLKL